MALRCGTTGPPSQGPQMREKNEDIGGLEIESMIIEIEGKHMVSSLKTRLATIKELHSFSS